MAEHDDKFVRFSNAIGVWLRACAPLASLAENTVSRTSIYASNGMEEIKAPSVVYTFMCNMLSPDVDNVFHSIVTCSCYHKSSSTVLSMIGAIHTYASMGSQSQDAKFSDTYIKTKSIRPLGGMPGSDALAIGASPNIFMSAYLLDIIWVEL